MPWAFVMLVCMLPLRVLEPVVPGSVLVLACWCWVWQPDTACSGATVTSGHIVHQHQAVMLTVQFASIV